MIACGPWLATWQRNDSHVTHVGTSPGVPTPHGIFPLNDDALRQMSVFQPGGVFVGFAGTMPCDGAAYGTIVLPNNPNISGVQFYVAFVAVPLVFDPPPWGSSNAVLIEIQ